MEQDFIELERTFRGLSVNELFNAFIDNKTLRKWWGPESEIDPKKNGKYRFQHLNMETKPFIRGEVLNIIPNKSLELSWHWDSEAAKAEPSKVQFLFSQNDLGATVKLKHDVSKTRNACPKGWNSTLNRLGDALPFHFDYTRFEKKIYIRATPETVYNAWVIPSEITKWFLANAEKYTKDWKKIEDNKPIEAGQFFNFIWPGPCDSDAVTMHELVPNKKIRFDFDDVSVNGLDMRSMVTVSLEAVGDYTQVNLKQEGIQDTPRARIACFHNCSLGWSFFLLNLKTVLEHGIDQREKKPEHQGTIN